MKFNFKNILKNRKALVISGITSLAIAGTILANTVNADPTPGFVSGDIVTGGNRSFPHCDWCDPIQAGPGHLIEFRMMVQNNVDGSVANDVTVKAQLPESPQGSPLVARATATSQEGASVTDTLTVNVSGSVNQQLAYAPGHARVFSPACPSGCNVGDSVTSSGINVGSLGFGESAQVLWKAYVSNIEGPTPTATPAPTQTPTPTATATPAPTTPPGGGTNNACVNNSCNSNANANASVTINQPAVAAPQVVAQAPSTAKSLPKTGLPLAGAAMAGLLPVGLKLRKKFAGIEDESANFIWEQRLFKKD